jgi:alkylation response protein AidB-like acyl-CoA dehydrogenase
MSFDLNDDQLAFQQTARRFAREKLASGYQRREAEVESIARWSVK